MVVTQKLTKSLLGITLLLSAPACALAGAPVTASAPATATTVAPSVVAPEKKEGAADSEETYRLLKLFGDVFQRVRAQYVEPVKDEELVEAAINGMLTHLDPHSSYMNRDEWHDMQVQTRGEFGGLGIEVTMDNGAVKVVSPIDDTPASRAGLQSGDLVVELDEQAVMGLTLQEAVNKMRGPAGTQIKLTVVRQGAGEPLHFTLTRAVIRVESVKWRAEGKVGYVRITSFTDRTQAGLDRAIADLKKQIGSDLQGWVLDLRNNPGGLLDQAISVSDTFLNDGQIVSTHARNPEESESYNATTGDEAEGKPVVVLVNAGSASASEIVAGALQDHHRAIILGTRSFGKGSVQTVIPLTGYGAMRLTTARYYTPSGRSIQAEGIVPDIEVKQAKVEVVEDKGISIRESNLNRALTNDHPAAPPAATPAPAAPEQTPVKPEGAKPDTPKQDAPKPESGLKPGELAPAEDFQLARGLDLIHGLWIFAHPQSTAPAPASDSAAADAVSPPAKP